MEFIKTLERWGLGDVVENFIDSAMESFNLRLKNVLDKLVEPNFKLKDDAYLNLLLTHLTTESTDDDDGHEVNCQNMVNEHLVVDWLVDIITKWAKTKIFPQPHILAFMMNMLKRFCVDEEIFVKLNSENVFEYLLEIANRVMSPFTQPNVELALVKLLYSFMDHEAGLQWMISENHWKIVLNSALNSHTVYISKVGCKCIARLLVATTPRHSTLCRNIIQLIVTPLIEAFDKVAGGDGVAPAVDDTFYKRISSTLQLIIEILLRSLENQVCSNEKEVILMVTEQYNLEKCVHKLIPKIDDEDFLHDLYKILIVLCFFDMHFKSCNKKVICSGQLDTTVKLFDVLYDAVSKGPVTLVLKIIFSSLEYWQIMEKTFPIWVSPKRIALSFKDQLVLLQMLPANPFYIENIRLDLRQNDEEEYRSRFLQKIMDQIIPTTIRICYKLKHHISENNSLSYGTMALKYVLHSKKYYNRENAILAFQVLTYILIDITSFLETHPDSKICVTTHPEYFALLLESITVIIEEFSITWKDTTESFCVLQTVLHFLNTFTNPSRVLVKALKLADVAVSRYMSPNMALLIDTVDSSSVSITTFTSMINEKLNHGEWEVRDSAIKLICAVAKTANTDFSSFRKPMTQYRFPDMVLNMALADESSFVRATAFKCLQEMIQIGECWHSLSTKGNILEKCLEVLHIESEGIVRTEIANLIHYMFRYQDIPENILDKFYDVMSHAVVADLHSEVRVKALRFWKTIIEHHLTQQGMIDGIFPSFTFSKEHRKIINLKEDQIKKNLIKVLHQLSLNGCLAVFYTALQDQCDKEVSKYAYNAISDFVTLLKKYEITSSEVATGILASGNSHQRHVFGIPPNSCSSSEMSNHNMFPNEIPNNKDGDLENILEEILDLQDNNLLQSAFNSFDQPMLDDIQSEGRTVLSPTEFVNFVYSNFEGCTYENGKQVKRIDDFNSLLHDILKEYDVNDINSMDCY